MELGGILLAILVSTIAIIVWVDIRVRSLSIEMLERVIEVDKEFIKMCNHMQDVIGLNKDILARARGAVWHEVKADVDKTSEKALQE